MNKWDDLPEDFYQIDSLEDNKNRLEFLKSLGIDPNNIPDRMYENFIFLDERSVLINKNNSKYETVYIKDVIGTTHQDYGNLPLIKSFKRLKRAADRCAYLKKHTPMVYHRQLHKEPKDQWTHNLPIGFIKIGDKYFIHGNGNHRTIIYKIMYLAELDKAEEIKEIEKIKKKYYIKAIVYSI